MKHLRFRFAGMSRTRPGALLLMTVLTVGAVILTIGLVLAQSGIREMDNATASMQSQRLSALLDSCLEEVLLRVKLTAVIPSLTLTVDGNTCSISNQRDPGYTADTVTVIGTTGTYTRTLDALVSYAPPPAPPPPLPPPPPTPATVDLERWRILTQ